MEFRIIWKNTATKEVTVFTEEDSGSENFYRFAVPQGLSSGEYEYYITTASGTIELDENDVRLSTIDGETIEIYDCGVAQVGTISRATTTYKITKQYEQYGN